MKKNILPHILDGRARLLLLLQITFLRAFIQFTEVNIALSASPANFPVPKGDGIEPQPVKPAQRHATSSPW